MIQNQTRRLLAPLHKSPSMPQETRLLGFDHRRMSLTIGNNPSPAAGRGEHDFDLVGKFFVQCYGPVAQHPLSALVLRFLPILHIASPGHTLFATLV